MATTKKRKPAKEKPIRTQFMHSVKGGHITTSLVVASKTMWANMPESMSPLWQACHLGDTVYAMAVAFKPIAEVSDKVGLFDAYSRN